MPVLNLLEKNKCTYEEVSLGEVMLRLDPGEGRIRCARTFNAWEGGGEYNVARALRKCFGLKTSVLTAFAKNEIGYLLEDLIMQGGVDTSYILWRNTDGIGRTCRNGLNFTERGFGLRGAVGCSDRANTAISKTKAEDFDLEKLFVKEKVRWLHTGGIYSSLSEESCKTAVDVIRFAKENGTTVSYDLNYRPSLWNAIGGIEKARQVNKEIVSQVDVLFGNEEDFYACLGLESGEASDKDKNFSSIDKEGYEEMLRKTAELYPNLKVIATTLRTVKSASVNDWSALCFAEGKIWRSREYNSLEILDRVGGGDSFASGLIYGLLTEKDMQTALELGTAHGALAMTTPGDTSMARLSEVEALVSGKNARIIR